MDAEWIPYGRQDISEGDIQAVVEVLRHDYLTQGPAIKKFEDNFSAYVRSRHSIAVSNGTAALHLASKALGMKKGAKVVTTPLTFAASANAVLYNEGEVVFCDIDQSTGLMDVSKLRELIEKEPSIEGVIPVSYAGYPIDTEAIRKAIGSTRWMVEDACHAPGGWYTDSKGDKIFAGSSAYSDAATFSFHPVKHIAAGEGGMVTCNDDAVANSIQILRTHGITKDEKRLESNHGGWYYEMQDLGYNYRLTDIQAALGNSQLLRLDHSLAIRNQIADRYDSELEGLPIELPTKPSEKQGLHAFHLYVIKTNRRKALYDYLKERKIAAQVHYVPIHLHPFYQKLGFKSSQFPEAEAFYHQCLSLPIFPTLKPEQQGYVIEAIKTFFS